MGNNKLKVYQTLINEARLAKKNSYSPYSNFRVGVALLGKSGIIYKGCNIENSSYSLTICAERTALFKAISEGERSFRAIAIASDAKNFISPCGACRQVILELAGNIDVVLITGNGKSKVLKMNTLLPHPFNQKTLKQ